MVSSSKILTVSYGTFSCTLEGFDDSFDTMKAIAEYFRDLAQDDRYFGAEPPTPDAEMLARIAEREISRRVEARVHDGSVVLRPSLGHTPSAAAPAAPPEAEPAAAQPEAAAAQPEAAAQPAPATPASDAAAPAAMRETDPDADMPVSTAGDATPSQDAPPAPSATPASVAEKLKRIRAVVAPTTAAAGTSAAMAEPAAETHDPAAEAAAAVALAEKISGAAAAPAQDAMADAAGTASLDHDAPETADASEAAGNYEAEPDEYAAPDAEPAVEDAAEDTRAAEAAPHLDSEPAFEQDEPSPETGEPALDEDLAFDTITAVSDAMRMDPAPDHSAADASDTDAADAPDLPTEDDTWAADDTWVEDDEDLADAVAEVRAVTEAEDAAADDSGDAPEAEILPEPPMALTPDMAVPSEPAAAGVRAARISRSDFDAALAAGAIEPVEEDEDDPLPADETAPGLSAEDEDDLSRELAALEAELAGTATEGSATEDHDGVADGDDDDIFARELETAFADDAEDDDADDGFGAASAEDDAEPMPEAKPETAEAEAEDAAEDDADLASDADDADEADDAAPAPHVAGGTVERARRAVKMSSPARAMLTEGRIGEDDSSVSRLMEETDKEFEEPEGSRRRSAIAHLRAAVAATRADRLLGRRRSDAEEAEPYREDLATVVRPRRPQSAGGTPRPATERPETPRPAPLKLVAEQRVNAEAAPAPQPAEAVRPRRVSRDAAEAAVPAAAPEQSFADFAREMGAVELPELLEAAAAYMSFVEERPQFSRPQLMTLLRDAEDRESSREDRLRSFGQLLREGKIAKIEGGRFTASKRIGFRPDGGRAVG